MNLNGYIDDGYAKGNVGSTEGGLPFLEEENIIPVILETAEQSPISSVRG
jgi:large subunit ribosomal protein L17e